MTDDYTIDSSDGDASLAEKILGLIIGALAGIAIVLAGALYLLLIAAVLVIAAAIIAGYVFAVILIAAEILLPGTGAEIWMDASMRVRVWLAASFVIGTLAALTPSDQ